MPTSHVTSVTITAAYDFDLFSRLLRQLCGVLPILYRRPSFYLHYQDHLELVSVMTSLTSV